MMCVLVIVAAMLLPTLVWAAGAEFTYPNDKVEIDWSDKASMSVFPTT